MLTLNEVKASLPVAHRNNIDQGMVNQLNSLSKDPEEARYMRENFVSFSQVLEEGRFKMGDYVRAVMYVSYKVMSKSNLKAYIATFPERYQNMVQRGTASKDIASVVAAYNKGILVNKIMQQAIIPTWILNQSMFQSALQTQFDLMSDEDVSDKVRCDAANSLLTHLKKPDEHKAELKIDIAVNDGMSALEARITEMSKKQLNLIEHDPSVSAQDIASETLKSVN